ncbi:PAS domain S-box protein [Mesorhizobium sp. CN2-181]|uniref:PAS domain-containing hybrid sensor histidine kinase/response regulator n=1 Tax=Mesorhizobium yinganensis TaxID=3157707 RepID=UPI0032B82CEF
MKHPFLAGGGDAADIIANFHWASTPLGPIDGWPPSLKSSISLILRSPVPIVTLWGEDGIMIYNDGYSEFAGGRHPALFGSKVREGWPEVADFNDNVMKVGLGGGTLAYRDQVLILSRNGSPEDVWLDLDYSPLLDENGIPAGVMAIVVEITDKIKARQALDAERESLRRMFDQAPGFIAMTTGPQHRFTMANDAYNAMVGYREVVGKTVGEALPEVISQGFIKLLDQVYQSGQPFVGRAARVDLAGADEEPDERYLDFVYQPIIAEGGSVSGIFIQGHDVTDQKRTELALRESEERFRLVAENAPVMLWMGDQDSRCVYLNKAQREFWGVSQDDVPAFDWFATVKPHDHKLLKPFQDSMRTHTPFSIETRMRHADGSYRIVTTNAQPRFGPRKEFIGMIGVNVDVTEARKTERAIRKESQKLSILNRTGASVAEELDVERIVQIVTDACTELVGAQFGAFFYNVINAAGESYMLYALSGVPREAFSQFPMPRNTAVFEPTFKGDGVVRSDDILLDPRYGKNEPYKGMPVGHLPVRSYLAVPVVSRAGEVIGGLFFGHEEPGRFKADHEELLIGIAGQAATAIDNARLFQAREREVAERRRTEAALQTLNATLEQRVLDEVAERSKAEEQLRQVQKMEAVGQLTGGIAHDFNNMLAVILGGLNLLQRKLRKGETDVERFVEGAIDGAQRAAALTQRLLAFSRQQPLAPEPMNANRMVSGMSELLARTLGEQIDVETVLTAGLWQVKADPGQLENAILNLSVNARDAMSNGGRLTIETSNAFVDDAFAKEFAITPGQYVLIAVADTGTGMNHEVIAKAFDPFFTTKSVGKGTGLGLSQVYGFVRQSGGHVKIYSEVNVGTTVKVYLPRYYGDSSEMEPRSNASITNRGLPTEIILVVEDEDRVRAVSVEALSELGYGVIEASRPSEALRKLESGPKVALLFTDVVMPEMSGRELADMARKMYPDLKVLYTTGYTRNAIVHNGILDPGTSLLTKPFSLEDLAAKVRKILDG